MALSIRGKGLLGGVLIIAILVAPTIYSVFVLRRISDLTRVFLSQDAQAGVLVSSIGDSFGQMARAARLSRIDPDYRTIVENTFTKIQADLETLRADAGPSMRTSLLRFDGAVRRFNDQAMAESGEAGDLESAETEVRAAISRLRAGMQEVYNRRTQETEDLAERSAALTLSATLTGFLVAAALGAVLLRSLNRPLRDLVSGTERIAEGRFDEKIPVRADDELGRLSLAFNEMAEALGELERLKAEFIATASHGLRTPLACAKGYLSALGNGRQGALDEASLRSIRRVEAEVDRVSRFVDQLLDLGRLRAGRLLLSMREVPAAALFTSIGRSFDALADEKRIDYRIEVKDGLPPRITADPDRLGEALINLLGNAFKYTPEGGKVSLSIAPIDGRARVEVADSGPGIPEEEVPLIFQRYFRGEGVAVEGSGLGLAISKEIVERHGGKIWAESGAGAGARFIFEVPFVPPPVRGNDSGGMKLSASGAWRGIRP